MVNAVMFIFCDFEVDSECVFLVNYDLCNSVVLLCFDCLCKW